MLDLFAVFTRGGALLWTLQFTALKHSYVEALNALIRTCLLEERSSETNFTYVPKNGAHQSLKWTFHNGLGLVFVAAYQKALSLMYVDELLAAAKAEFVTNHYQAGCFSYPAFTEPFQKLLKDCEARADTARQAGTQSAPASRAVASNKQAKGPASQKSNSSKPSTSNGRTAGASRGAASGASEQEDEDGADAAAAVARDRRSSDDGVAGDSAAEDHTGTGSGAFDLSKLPKGGSAGRGGPRGRMGKPPVHGGKPEKKVEKEGEKKKEKKARHWGAPRGGSDNGKLDYSEQPSEWTAGSESEGPGFHSDADNGPALVAGVSRMDVEEDEVEVLETIDEAEYVPGAKGGAGNSSQATKSRGLLGSFMSNLAMRVVGKQALTAEDLAPALADMKRKLMERNVAEEIAQNICNSVGRSLEGQKLASFTGVGTFVARAFEEALSGILHKRTTDMLLGIREAQARGRPYVVVFCGVNGVGKSTNLAKIAYWLGSHNIKVLIAACDTFRAGAVEQLKTHCARLKVPLYERGYEKDPAKVAAEAIKQAEREGRDVVLVDTAGRMQDNEPLMRALSSLINVNNPNLVLFVGEALVGNDAVDQLVKFNRALHDLAPPTATHKHGIDGIVLTKFDTIDDKVGAAVSMVYASSAPIMFLGCGQTYADLKRLNVKSVVNALLK